MKPRTTRAAPQAAAGPDVPATRRALLAWFGRNARDLPWRSQRDPWRVWVSEVMLQQTRVEAVIDPYRRFIESFPTLADLASAEEADVLAQWSGLGFYRRARMLHAGARHVVTVHDGTIPDTRDALEKVPGIGSYTAGALLAIAFGRREPALDANVTRVVARLCAILPSTSGRTAIAEFASALVDCTRPGDVNEALMDLGSAVCTAKSARCDACPLRPVCRAHASGTPLAFAPPRQRTPARDVKLACAVVSSGDRVLFLQRPSTDALLAGLWDLPTVELEDAPAEEGAAQALRDLVHERTGLDLALRGPLLTVRHDIVGRKISAQVYEATVRFGAGVWPRGALADAVCESPAAGVAPGRTRPPDGARMLAAAERRSVGMPALPVKILTALSARPEPAAKTREPGDPAGASRGLRRSSAVRGAA